MSHSNAPRIRIAPVDDSSNRYIAIFTSETLGATFSVVFKESVTGAVALHSFAEMVRSRYGTAPELTVVDRLPQGIAVSDVMKTLDDPAFSRLTSP